MIKIKIGWWLSFLILSLVMILAARPADAKAAGVHFHLFVDGQGRGHR